MKIIIKLLIAIIMLSSCRFPSDPLGEIKIIKRIDTINTGGNCLDLDLDIEDNILVAAANYNGYFIYKLNFINGIVSDIIKIKHVSANEMDNSIGDNRAQSVQLSIKHNIAFVMDQYDHIWMYKYTEGATQYSSPNYLDEDCYGGTWLSFAIDDQIDNIGIYALVKHSAAEFMPYCINEQNLSSIGTDQGCSDIQEYIETDLNNQNDCNLNEGYSWMYPGCKVGNFSEYSTSLIWKNLEDVSLLSTSQNGDPDCEYITNQASSAEQIYFSNDYLAMSYNELGVKIYQKSKENLCLVDSVINIESLDLCEQHLFPITPSNSGTIDYRSCCNNDPCPPSKPNCKDDIEYINDIGTPGLGGKFSSIGGIIPIQLSEFDTPGEVEALYTIGDTIFTGLSNSNGFMVSVINSNGTVEGPNQFALGYTIKGIHQNNGLLALAAAHDGILLYHWNNMEVLFLGKIETSYANNVIVQNRIIYAATEDGIEIIQIDY